MPRVTHVAKARQRYERVQTGETIEVNRKTKSGRAVTAHKSVSDIYKPLSPRTCDHCGKPIEVGTSYKWIQPRTGPYGGSKRFRHESCPTWQVWEYSNSLSAMISQAQHDAELTLALAGDQSDFEQVRDDFAAAIRDLADQKTEAADNIESGFGHETYQSEEIRETAGELEGWADEIESWQAPDEPEPEEGNNEPTEDQLGEWREETRDDLQNLIDQSPV